MERSRRQGRLDGLGRKIWTLGWGLFFVVGMTLLSECGPRLVDSKVPAASAVSGQAVRVVK